MVAAALVDVDGRVLIAQRPQGQAARPACGSSPAARSRPQRRRRTPLIRELREELGIEAKRDCLAASVFASHAYEDFHLLMPLFLLRRWEGEVERREHAALKWVKPIQLFDFPMPPADAPLCAWLRDIL